MFLRLSKFLAQCTIAAIPSACSAPSQLTSDEYVDFTAMATPSELIENYWVMGECITLRADEEFEYRLAGCLGVIETSHGTWRLEDGFVVLEHGPHPDGFEPRFERLAVGRITVESTSPPANPLWLLVPIDADGKPPVVESHFNDSTSLLSNAFWQWRDALHRQAKDQ
jgi:hypothetical protein